MNKFNNLSQVFHTCDQYLEKPANTKIKNQIFLIMHCQCFWIGLCNKDLLKLQEVY